MASSVGKVINDPEPTIVLMVPARKAAPTRSRASRTDMVPGTVDCEPFTSWECGTVADDKQPVQKAVGLFVSRGKREVQSHLPGHAPTPPSPPPVPPEVKRRIDESVGVAKYMAEGGLGAAREVAGSGIGVARELAGSALAQFLAMRANG